MKKSFLIVLFLILLFTSCERDDICIDPVTPNLIIRLYDAENIESFKSISGLKIEILNLDDPFETTVSGDSLVIPLRIDQDLTEYKFSLVIDENTTLEDNLTVSYNREEQIVGRSCGFKTVFNNVSLDNINAQEWIQNIQIDNTPLNIINETSAHVKIFH